MRNYLSVGLSMLLMWVALLLAPPMLAGCGGNAEQVSVVKEQLALTQELLDTLRSVKDLASARAAESKLKEFAKRQADLEAKIVKLPQTSSPSSAEIQYGTQLSALGETLMEERQRISAISPEVARIVNSAIGG